MLKSLLIVLIVPILMFPMESAAFKFKGAVGKRVNFVGESQASLKEYSSEESIQFGVRMSRWLSPWMQFRYGLSYSQFNVSHDASGGIENIELTFIDVPITIGYSDPKNVATFIGIAPTYNSSGRCSSSGGLSDCEVQGVKKLHSKFIFGVEYLFSKKYGLEVYYEKSLGAVADTFKSTASFGCNFLFQL